MRMWSSRAADWASFLKRRIASPSFASNGTTLTATVRLSSRIVAPEDRPHPAAAHKFVEPIMPKLLPL